MIAPSPELSFALSQILALSRRGFSRNDPSCYAEIAELAKPHLEAPEMAKIVHLAEVGPTLISKRLTVIELREALAEEAWG